MNSSLPVRTAPMSSFISTDKNGRVTIQNAVVFQNNEIGVHFGGTARGLVVKNLQIFCTVPKWWQVLRWWRLIQLIRAACRKENNDEQ